MMQYYTKLIIISSMKGCIKSQMAFYTAFAFLIELKNTKNRKALNKLPKPAVHIV